MKTPTRIVALLPMKANSERVKGKNFRPFNGKPLFRWILDTLLSIEQIGHAHGGTGGHGGVCRQAGQQRVSAVGVIGANTVLTTAEQ